MNKIVKRILIGIGAFIFLLIAAVAVLFIVVDPNDYRDEISQMAYKATGRKIDLKGDISLKIFPGIGFSIKDVSVAQAEGFDDKALAHVNELTLRMALFPLLQKQVQVDAIILDGLNLNLAKDAKGRYNWEVEQAAPSAASTEKAPDGTTDTPATGDAEEAEKRMHALLQSRISRVSITDCVLSYNDIPAKESMAVRLNKLELGNVGLNRDISCELDVAAELDKNIKAAFSMDGQARYELAEKLLKLDVKSFAVSGEAPEFLSGRQEIKGKLNALLNATSGQADLKAVLESAFLNGNADISMNKAGGKGALDLKTKPVALVKALSASMQKSLALPPELLADNGPLRSLDAKFSFSQAGNTINVSTAEVRLGGSEMILSAPAAKAVLADKGGLSSADSNISLKGSLTPYLPLAGISPKGGAFSKIDSSLAFKLAGDNLTISNLKLVIDDKLVELSSKSLAVRMAPAGPLLPIHSVKADLSLAAKPRALMNGLDIKLDTADPKALESFQTSLSLAVDNVSAKLGGLKGKLDDTDISGSLEVLLPGAAGIPRGATSYTKADLQLGDINLDRYLSSSSGGASDKKAEPAGKPGGQSSGGPLKGTPLEKARAEITAGIRNLTVMKAPVQNIALNCVLADGVLTVNKAALKTFDGQFNLSARADLVNASGPGSLKVSLAGLDMGKAMLTMFDEKRLTGQAGSNLDFTFKGVDSENILKTLNGKGDIQLKNGELRDFQLIPADAPAGLLKHRISNYSFNDLGGTFTVTDGKLNNNDLSYKDKNMSLTGKGSVTLYDRQVDYSGVLNTKETGDLPLRITGPLSSLKIALDQEALARIAAEKAKEELSKQLSKELEKKGVTLPQGQGAGQTEAMTSEERKEEAKKQVNEKVGQELQKGLDKLFKK